ncbi:MAG: carboxypeptidase regulatory-like domain-containing protein [Thermoplasmata archaeon]
MKCAAFSVFWIIVFSQMALFLLPLSADTQIVNVKSTSLSGHVLDVYGNGINGAVVVAKDYLSGTEIETHTDANGFFQFNVEESKMFFLRVYANGYYHKSKHDCTPGAQYELVLNRSAAIIGKITDKMGAPINNASLKLSNPKYNVEIYTCSDATGAFRFTSTDFDTQMYPGEGYEIIASATGFLSAHFAENLTIKKGEDTFVTILLERSARISGIVRGAGGETVSGAVVYATDLQDNIVCTNITDQSGRYVLDTELVAGNYKVQVFPPTDPEGSWLNSERRNVSIAMNGATVENVDFILDKAAVVKGNITDDSGGVDNAVVMLTGDNGKFAYGTSTLGTFTVSSPVLTSGTYTIRVECAHHIFEENTIVLQQGNITWIDFNLSKSRSVSGYIKDAAGNNLFGSVEIFEQNGESIEKIYTSQNGYYKLDTNLHAATYRLEACAPGYVKTSRTVDLTTDFNVEFFNFTLAEAGKCIINITDSAGNRIPNAMGFLVMKTGDSYQIYESSSSGPNGTFIFGENWQNLPEGTYSLFVRNAPGCEDRFFENLVSVEQGKTNWYSVSLNKSAELYGHVYYRKNTEPLEDVYLEFTKNFFTGTSALSITDAEGYFHIMTGISGGIYVATARHYKYGSTVQSDIAVNTEEKKEVNLYFFLSSGAGGITGSVKEKNGNQLSGVDVSVYNGTRKVKSVLTDENGDFYIGGIPEGKYRVTFAKQGYVTLELYEVIVISDENTSVGTVELDLYIPPPGNITGYVVDTSGLPVPGASVVVEGTEISIVTGSMGEFQILSLKEGVYNLLVSSPGYKDARETVSVTSGNNTTIWIQLQKEEAVKTTSGMEFMTACSAIVLGVLFLAIMNCVTRKPKFIR